MAAVCVSVAFCAARKLPLQQSALLSMFVSPIVMLATPLEAVSVQ